MTTLNESNSETEKFLQDAETQHCLDSVDYLLKYKDSDHVAKVLNTIVDKCRKSGVSTPFSVNTPYINTIPTGKEPEYPGDIEVEKKLEDIIRWNAMAMVIKANRTSDGIGGHISTFASLATLYEVGFNHFFKGNDGAHKADQIFFQGHASPGNYSRSFLEGRLTAEHLHNFRRDLKDKHVTSYPHPYIMPDYWQFPTVSMGLGPIMSIYQARFNKYLSARKILKDDKSNVWCFIGDGECDEPETLGALTLASRESLDNLTFVINCNLQRLDGPVRGNGKMIQELEAIFRGAGWNVIKVVWGSNWDELLSSPHRDILIKRMEEAVDGEYQKYVVEPGSYFRKHFFGKYPELLEMVNHLTDSQLKELLRGGHDPKKVYAAYKQATEHKGAPTVILAKTVKGYGLGEAGEGKNISHQQKKMNEKELREFRDKLNIPIDDEEVVETPFYRPKKGSKEHAYLLEQREKLGGFMPERKVTAANLETPKKAFFEEFYAGSGDNEISTTMGLVRIMTKLIRDKDLGNRIVPIIPDEARTFGMESLFRQVGIYSQKGQLYEPVDSESLLYYREEKDGQILEEGINECGAMCSFISAGTAYATHGTNMIPFFIYYSMFGFQRIGDLMWLAGDIRAKGFLVGGTAGRTTLNGEGLQHQDGHSHVLASTIPSVITYDPAFRFEIAVIVEDGLRRMYENGEEVYYYLTVGNENYKMPEMPEGVEEGILRGLYKFKEGEKLKKPVGEKVHLFGSGSILNEALRAQEILADKYNVSADVWSATNYKRLRYETLECQRWNMLNPDKKAKTSYLQDVLSKEKGTFVAASDNMRIVPEQIQQWVPGGLFALGTDGFGRSESREALRRYFEVDAESIVIGTLYSLSQKGKVETKLVKKAIKDLGVDPEKTFPKWS
jgi:pyruvate dehydrogenase E1 component